MELMQLTQYNSWANHHIINLLLTLNDEQLDRALGGSFETIRKTVYHVWGAEAIWVQRFRGELQMHVPWKNFEGDLKQACEAWQQESAAFTTLCRSFMEKEQLKDVFHYKNLKGDAMQNTYEEALAHVVNHSTFHRGQLVNYLRMLGVSGIVSTDLITFFREKNAVKN